MTRQTDLLRQLLQSNETDLVNKEKEQKFLTATAQLILTDFINIAINGFQVYGPGSLVINLVNDSTTYMTGSSVENDLALSESEDDEDVTNFLRSLINQIDKNDWSKNLLITLISDAGTRTFAVEAGRSQECFRALAEEFTG